MKKIFLTIAVLFTVVFTSCSKDNMLFDQTQCKIVGEWDVTPENPNTYNPMVNICDISKPYLNITQKGNTLNVSGFFNTTGTFSDDIIFFNDTKDTTYIEYRCYIVDENGDFIGTIATSDSISFTYTFMSDEYFGPDSNYIIDHWETYVDWEQLSFPYRVQFIDDNTIKFTLKYSTGYNDHFDNDYFEENLICYRR